jgi:hypothetical protein
MFNPSRFGDQYAEYNIFVGMPQEKLGKLFRAK